MFLGYLEDFTPGNIAFFFGGGTKQVFLDPHRSRIHPPHPLWAKDLWADTHTHTQQTAAHTGDMNVSVWVLTQLQECVEGKDGGGRLMSAGTGRIMRRLMNECKLAMAELIPPPGQD